ncbi:ATP-binding cassette domain-containing protein [Actinoalloteichus hoggarensis]|uniref:ATP-binding cassette domain-containing protein n=1 Tax=Actinoalloteichus hoggarensis TaxID=1470176 RepID=UPI00161B6675
MQDVRLLDGTIEENVRAGRPDADDAAAAEVSARLDEVVDRGCSRAGRRRPGGRRPASGGERQRVSIAQVLLKDVPFVLLDEVISAVDPDHEAALHEGVERLSAAGPWRWWRIACRRCAEPIGPRSWTGSDRGGGRARGAAAAGRSPCRILRDLRGPDGRLTGGAGRRHRRSVWSSAVPAAGAGEPSSSAPTVEHVVNGADASPRCTGP